MQRFNQVTYSKTIVGGRKLWNSHEQHPYSEKVRQGFRAFIHVTFGMQEQEGRFLGRNFWAVLKVDPHAVELYQNDRQIYRWHGKGLRINASNGAWAEPKWGWRVDWLLSRLVHKSVRFKRKARQKKGIVKFGIKQGITVFPKKTFNYQRNHIQSTASKSSL